MRSQVEFQFKRLNPIFFSGETIKGCIILTTHEDKHVKGVFIRFCGEAKVFWTDTSSRYWHDCEGLQKFVNAKTQVFEEGLLPKGVHIYSIEIHIPANCVTSFSDTYGHINYKLMLILEMGPENEEVHVEGVTVIQPLNLNWDHVYWLPLRHEVLETMCCWPCKQGNIYIVCTIPFSGFAPGQKIPYQLEIHNRTHGNNLNGYEIALQQKITYEAQIPQDTKVDTNTLNVLKKSVIMPQNTLKQFVGELCIPAVPPTTQLIMRSIIRIEYYVEVTIKTGTWHLDPGFHMPITIGTSPLVTEATTAAAAAAAAASTTTAVRNEATVALRPEFQATSSEVNHKKFIDKKAKEQEQLIDYKPKYPVYNDFALPQLAPDANAETCQQFTGFNLELLRASDECVSNASMQQKRINSGISVINLSEQMQVRQQSLSFDKHSDKLDKVHMHASDATVEMQQQFQPGSTMQLPNHIN